MKLLTSEKYRVRFPATGTISRIGMVALSLITLLTNVYAQRANTAAPPGVPNVPPASASGSSSGSVDTMYRIGPGDLLSINILNRPNISSDGIRVDGRGMIQMPLIDGDIQAACKTERELAKDIAVHYVEYLKNPSVKVFVKEYESQPVAVVGAVNAPGRFLLQRRIRLLELLSFAGGPAERAGTNVQIIHTSSVSCNEPEAAAPLSDSSTFDSFNLNELLNGDDKSNPYIQPGDIVSLPTADQAFVVGNVFRPSAIPLKAPVTVSQAIAMAGGILPSTKSDQIRIVRQVSKAKSKEEIRVDLKAITQRHAEDIMLQPNDIVDVPSSGTKVFLNGLAGAVAPTLSRLPSGVIR
ncbi:MAG: polysaccharide biosynthesis/export protein [Blastocatellia bacterium]|nr:polysaccharide biosynthesis/export protein [Blastocatellia bacterium]